MASVRRPRRRGLDGKLRPYRAWYAVYKDEHGERRQKKGYTDKAATLALAVRLEKEAARRREGLAVVDSATPDKTLVEVQDVYLAELEGRGRSRSHVYEQRRLLTAVGDDQGWVSLRSIRGDGLRAFLAKLPDPSPRTLNAYRGALVAFCNWCVAQNPPLMQENPVAHVAKARSEGGVGRKPRRAYTLAEWKSLVGHSPHNGLVYTVAGLSGLRKRTLRLLEKRDCDPGKLLWKCRAEIMKGRRPFHAPMLAECAAAIRKRWDGLKNPTDRLFPSVPRTKTLHADLLRAGIARVDLEGRCVDFHSLRYFFCTLVGKKLPVQTVRLLMHHKDVRETVNLYTDLGLTDVAEATLRLPKFLA